MTTRDIKNAIEESSSLELITQAYSELASIQLKKIRDEVERNRQFYDDLAYVYAIVKKVAQKKKYIIQPKPKQRLSILITSNYRFYGNINNELVKFFIVNNAKYPSDKLVIGDTGKSYLTGIRYFHQYSSMVLKKDFPTNDELKKMVEIMSQYNQVLVFYSTFKTVLTQQPIIKDISQTENIGNSLPDKKAEEVFEYIFEPELAKMLKFFDDQVKTLLLEQAFLESELARTASRLVSMDKAQGNAKEFIKNQRSQLSTFRKSVNNIRLLETFASLAQSKREAANDDN